MSVRIKLEKEISDWFRDVESGKLNEGAIDLADRIIALLQVTVAQATTEWRMCPECIGQGEIPTLNGLFMTCTRCKGKCGWEEKR